MDGVALVETNYKGDTFDRFYACRDSSTGPGWYVFGRNPSYGDRYVMLCARPDVKARYHMHYNNPIRRGWRTKREAQAVADRLNSGAR